MNIYICEDSIQEAQIIFEEVRKFSLFSDNEIEIKNIMTNPDVLLEHFSSNNFGVNVFLLDIDFINSQMNGLVLAKKIKEIDPQAYIVFITSHAELSFLTFKYKIGALDFIIKNSSENWTIQIIKTLKTIEQQLKIIHEKQNTSITLETSQELKLFVLDSILFFESSKTQKLSVTTLNSQYSINKQTLKSLENRLTPHFWRCRRSFLINKKHIQSIDKNKNLVFLTANTTIPISIRKKADIQLFWS